MSFIGTLKGLISDTVAVPVRVDASTHSLQTISYEHHEIHSGSHYEVRINKDVANGGDYNLAFTTPDTTKWIHMIFGIDVEVEANVALYEAITSFGSGTPVTPYNNNRNSVNTSGLVDMESDTTAVAGTPTQLVQMVLGSGKTAGGGARGSSEFVLKQNTTYLLEIDNQAAASNEVNIFLNWYEHTAKN